MERVGCTRKETEVEVAGRGEAETEVEVAGRGEAETEVEVAGRGEAEVEVAGRGEAEVEVAGRGEAEVEVAGRGEAEVEVAGRGEAEVEVAGRGEAEVEIAWRGEAEVEVAGRGEAEVEVAGRGEAEVEVAGRGEVEVEVAGRGEVEVEVAGRGEAEVEVAGGVVGCHAWESGLGPVRCRAGEDYRVGRSCVGSSDSRGSDVNIGSPGSEEIEASAAPTELTAGQSSDSDALGVCSTDGDAEEDGVDDQCEKLQEFWMKGDYFAADDTQLTLFQGDKVSLINVVTPDWWWVEHDGSYGYVPSGCLTETNTEEVDDPWQDDEYYGSYQTLKLHLEMLSDIPRTETYREVIKRNRASLLGKHILDLGCGTGIISLFCAQLAQPKAVYAVEASKIAQQTRRLIEKNGFSNVVHVIDQRAEEMELPTKVDVLVSEWMGTCLLFEFMLESVLLARDFWLKEDGVMWPSTASIHLVPCSAAREYASKVLFWDSLFQLDFRPLQSLAVKEFLSKPNPDYVLQPEDCLSDPFNLLDVNLRTLQIADLERMSGNFTFCVKNDGIFHGFTAWFSVQFQDIEDQGCLELNTGPFNMLTHWKHTLFMLDEPVHVHKGDRIRGTALFQRNPVWRRHMSVTLSWEITSDAHDVPYEVGCKKFPMWR